MSRWIAVDWGTSFFRAYLIEDELVSDKIETRDGMKFIQQNDFERKFISLIEKWLIRDHVVEVFASGMLGARQGWMEAPYEKTPCNLNNIDYAIKNEFEPLSLGNNRLRSETAAIVVSSAFSTFK